MPTTLPRRKRGAQPGNRNNYKHGFYAGSMERAERKDLTSASSTDLADEINLMRVYIRRAVSTHQPSTFAETVEMLRALSMASAALARLVRIQYLLTGSNPNAELYEMLDQAILELKEKYKKPQNQSSTPSGSEHGFTPLSY